MVLVALVLQGKGREHTSPMLKSQRRKAKAYSLLYFTLSALHRAEAQLMLVKLNLLNCTEGKRGLKGLGNFKSILQEGQFQVETEILNLWICLLGTRETYILYGKQISNIHIVIAEHLVLLMTYYGLFTYDMWKSILISNCNIIVIYPKLKFICFSLDFYEFLSRKQVKWEKMAYFQLVN